MKLPRLKLPANIDWIILILPTILTSLGIAVIFTITYGGTGHNLAIDQSLYFLIGALVILALSLFDYRTLKGLYLILYFVVIILLIIVLLFGSSSFGATRWINLYIFQLQPSEVAKIVVLIVLAKFFSDWQEISLKNLFLLLVLVLIPFVLILIQPDLGTASVVFVCLLALLFLSPIKKVYLIIGLVAMIALSPLGWHFLKTYQKNRVRAFINPTIDPQGVGYNVTQAKIAVGSGGLLGNGLGEGSQSRLNFLPVAHSDFIFAGAAEALGFIGSTFLILVLGFLIVRVFMIASLAKDAFGMYLASGIGIMFLFQTLVNIGMNLGIMPVTGIPLPFVSYGGSSMLVNCASIGILQSIYIRHRKITF